MVNIVAGARASTVAVTQASLPKPKTPLVVTIVSILVTLLVFGAYRFGNKGDGPSEMKINYENCCKEFDFWNGHINDPKSAAYEDAVKTALKKLKDMERMENNPKFEKLKINREFSAKLKAYRDNLLQSSVGYQNELIELQSEGFNIEDDTEDTYIQSIKKKKRLADTILELSKNGSVKDIDLRKNKG
jgi:hypothetical protein